MKINLMRNLDHYLGLPLCVILGILHKLVTLFRKEKPKFERIKKILVLKWFGLGSIVMFSPFLKEIKKKYKDAKITFLTFSSRKEIVEILKISDQIETISTSGFLQFLKDTFRQLIKLSMEKADVCIDLEFFSKFSTLISFLSGARIRIGLYLPFFWRLSLINFSVYFNPSKHILRTYKMICEVLGVKIEKIKYEKIEFSQEEKDEFRKKYLKSTNLEDKLIVINPNAGELAECRRWPKEYFVEVVENLSKRKNLKIVFIGTKEESGYVKEIIEELTVESKSKILDLSGRLNIKELLILISLSSLVITNDSGPLHLACLEKTPSLSIWGPGDPELFGIKDPQHKIIYLDYDCSPCIYLYRTKPALFCGGRIPCLKNIAPSVVIKEALNLLNEE